MSSLLSFCEYTNPNGLFGLGKIYNFLEDMVVGILQEEDKDLEIIRNYDVNN